MLVKETLVKDLDKKQQEIIKRLSNVGIEDINNKRISSLFLFRETKEKDNYWRNITMSQFEKDIECGKFDYLWTLSEKIDKLINKLENYE
jgi:hypothetical protein